MEVKMVRSSPHYDPKIYTIPGGYDSNPTWEEYLKNFREELRVYLINLREFLEENNLIGCPADHICNDYHFQFEDGTKLAFTWRAWGDLIQAIVGLREGYMTYYM